MSTVDGLIPAMEAYAAEHGHYPPAKSMQELRYALVPKYASDLSLRDGWGRPFHLIINPQDYQIWSLGADNRPDPPSADPPGRVAGRAAEDPNTDVIVHNGVWVRFPWALCGVAHGS